MKIADIEVGQRYKTRWHGVVEVLETRAALRGRRDGIRVKGGDYESMVRPAEILHPWTDEHETYALLQAQAKHEYEERVLDLRVRAKRLGVTADINLFKDTSRSVSMSIETFAALLAAYEIAMADK